MRYQTKVRDNIIRGSCSLFVCRFCRTKFGWAHQCWCDICSITEPTCTDCRYFGRAQKECLHPAIKQSKERRELPYEEDQGPF